MIDIAAELVDEGATLWFRNLSVFPEDPEQEIVAAGVQVLSRLLTELENTAREEGYTFLRISAYRISGRNPDRKIDITRKLR